MHVEVFTTVPNTYMCQHLTYVNILQLPGNIVTSNVFVICKNNKETLGWLVKV